MKKFIALILGCLLALSLTACGNDDYDAAVSLYEAGKYAEAEQMLVELGDYKDSIKLRLACRYGLAMELYEAGDYEQAAQMFKKLGSHENSAEMLLASHYAHAQAQQEAGEYESALELYAQAAGYEDSADKILECRQLYAAKLMSDEQYDKALPHLKALSRAGALDRSSNAVGWCALATLLQDTRVYAMASRDYTFTLRMAGDDTIEILARTVVEEEDTSVRNVTEERTMAYDYSVKIGYNAAQAEMAYSYNLTAEVTKIRTTRTIWEEESATATVELASFTPENVVWENIQYAGENWDRKAPSKPINAMTERMLSEIYQELDNALLELDLGISLRDLGFFSLAV